MPETDRAWKPYQASSESPWNRRRVVHLHRRAAWGATWEEIERDLAEGPDHSLDRLLSPGATDTKVLDHASQLTEQAVGRQQIELLQASWIVRIWQGNDPLGEQLTLMWHNHFATSQLKVRDVGAMAAQLELLRQLAREPFENLLRAMIRDRALLVWLDADSNQKGHPNENLARELMELFTLGEGNYEEDDVREAARALSGWTLIDGVIEFDSSQHDDGEKTILGSRGRWQTDDLITILLKQPATSRRLAWRICDHFLGPDAIPKNGVEILSEQLRHNGLNIGEAVATVIRSAQFFEDSQLGRRISSPASFVLGNLRALELHKNGVAPEVVASWMRTMGQDLLHPPGVGGWPGGRSWLGTGSMIDRARFVRLLCDGSLHLGSPRADLSRLMTTYDLHGSPNTFAQKVLFGEAEIPDLNDKNLASILVSTRAQFD